MHAIVSKKTKIVPTDGVCCPNFHRRFWAILLKSFKMFGRILIGIRRLNWLNLINLELSRNLELKFDSLTFQYVHNIFCSINMTHKTKNLCEFIENKIFGTITDITYLADNFFK